MRLDKVSSSNPRWKNWYAVSRFISAYRIEKPTKQPACIRRRISRHGTLTKAQRLSCVHARNCKVSKTCVRFRYTLTHRRISCAIGDVDSKRNEAKISIPFRLLYTDQHRLCIREWWARNFYRIMERGRIDSGISKMSDQRQPFSLKYPDKTCLFSISSRNLQFTPR